MPHPIYQFTTWLGVRQSRFEVGEYVVPTPSLLTTLSLDISITKPLALTPVSVSRDIMYRVIKKIQNLAPDTRI